MPFEMFSCRSMLRQYACYHVKLQFKRDSGFFEEYTPVFLAEKNVNRK